MMDTVIFAAIFVTMQSIMRPPDQQLKKTLIDFAVFTLMFVTIKTVIG
jgi:hypothetical protein